MRRIVTIAATVGALAASLALTACGGGDEGERAAATVTPAETNAASFDRAFIDAMVPHHEQAIAMAVAAKDAGLSQPDLVEIADGIIATQQGEIDQMLEWRAQWFGSGEVDPAGAEVLGFSMEQMGMQHDPADLGSADDVDATFAELMMDHHNGAITMAELALQRAAHPEMRELAAAIIAAQQREIQIMSEHAAGMMDHA